MKKTIKRQGSNGMERILEPEVMDTPLEAAEYDGMDFTAVNTAFAQRAIELAPTVAKILDLGTGTARIPILMCQLRSNCQVTAIDLAKSMLAIAQKNIEKAGLEFQIGLEIADAKQLPYPASQFDLVVSNSLMHHLPDPLPCLHELKRVLKPSGAILLRDLLRPSSELVMNRMVDDIGREYSARQRQLFRDSLQAAFTLDEVRQLLQTVGLEAVKVYQSSEQHWTVERAWG
jgi:ubiquinone/menaquinone biosynthesis C-methylase UbiE